MDIYLNLQQANQNTRINIDVNDAENINDIIKLLHSLSFIKKIEVVNPDITPIGGRFARFYGAAKTGLPAKELDKKIKNLRQEWERNI